MANSFYGYNLLSPFITSNGCVPNPWQILGKYNGKVINTWVWIIRHTKRFVVYLRSQFMYIEVISWVDLYIMFIHEWKCDIFHEWYLPRTDGYNSYIQMHSKYGDTQKYRPGLAKISTEPETSIFLPTRLIFLRIPY